MNYRKLVEEYTGRKVVIIATGGAIGLSKLAATIGSSKMLQAIYIPYETSESIEFIESHLPGKGVDYSKKAVSENSAKLLYEAGVKKWRGCRVLAATAATSSSRWRRGVNHAWFAIGDEESDVKTYHFQLPKLSEESHKEMGQEFVNKIRHAEDEQLSFYGAKLLFGLS